MSTTILTTHPSLLNICLISRGWNNVGTKRVEIRTDSNYAIKAATQFIHRWRENADENGNWYNSKGEIEIQFVLYKVETLPGLFFLITEVFIRFSGYPVKHQGVIEHVEELASYFKNVRYVKVPAHADETGNEGADRLAKLQIRRDDYCDECLIKVKFEELNLN